MKESKSKLLKQRLFRLHASAGISFSIIMYLAIFFGIFTILLPFIQTWEKPSRHIKQVEITKINYNSMIDKVLSDPKFPQNNIMIYLPGRMGDPAVSIAHRFVKPIAFDPNTNKKIQNESKDKSHLAKFLNELHYGQPLKFIGRLIFGLSAVGVMLLLITGVFLITILKFKSKGKNQQAQFSKFHIKIFSWLFAPLLLITLSGAIMNIGLVSAGPMSKILTKNEASSIDEVVGPILFPRNKPIKKLKQKAVMLPLSELLKKAKEINPQLILKEVQLINWYDKTARVQIVGYNPYKPFLNGGFFNKPYIILSAVTGKLITNKKVLDNKWPALFSEGIFFLHFLFGIDIVSRLIVAFMMLLCGIAIGFGVMLYLEKKAKKFADKVTFYHWLGKLSLSTMIGVIPATGTLFVTQWLLPFTLEDRVLWQQGIFYNTWLFTLFYSFYRINSYKASKEFFLAGGILFLLASILHQIKFTTLFSQGLANILGVDIALFLFGAILIFISKKLPNNREESKLFWIKKEKVKK